MDKIYFACNQKIAGDIERDLDTADNSQENQLSWGSGAFYDSGGASGTDDRALYVVDMTQVDADFMQRLDTFMQPYHDYKGAPKFGYTARMFPLESMIRSEWQEKQGSGDGSHSFQFMLRTDVASQIMAAIMRIPQYMHSLAGEDNPRVNDPDADQEYVLQPLVISSESLESERASLSGIYYTINTAVFPDGVPDDINARYQAIREAIGLEGLHFYRFMEPELEYGYSYDTDGDGNPRFDTQGGSSIRQTLLDGDDATIPKSWLDAYLRHIQGDGKGGISYNDKPFTNALDYWYGDEARYYSEFGGSDKRVSAAEFLAAAKANGEDINTENREKLGIILQTALHFKEDTLYLDLQTYGRGDPTVETGWTRARIFIDPQADFVSIQLNDGSAREYGPGKQFDLEGNVELSRAVEGALQYFMVNSGDATTGWASRVFNDHIPEAPKEDEPVVE